MFSVSYNVDDRRYGYIKRVERHCVDQQSRIIEPSILIHYIDNYTYQRLVHKQKEDPATAMTSKLGRDVLADSTTVNVTDKRGAHN